MAIYLDTHVVVWLFAGDPSRFPGTAQQALNRSELLISPIVLLELKYLQEIDRITAGPTLIADSLQQSIGLQISTDPFPRVILESLMKSWTRDPFDRVIAAQAEMHQLPLLTKDETIRAHYRHAFWD